MNGPRVLFATSEVAPFVKTGGLADVSAALPAALRALGADVRLLVPGYPALRSGLDLVPELRGLALLPGQEPVDLLAGETPAGVPVLVVASPLFDLEGDPYQDAQGRDRADNAPRFATLARAAALLGSHSSPGAWHPQLVHANDWQSALSAAYLHFDAERRARSILTVHNLAFAGAFDPDWVERVALPARSFTMEGVEFYGRFSFLKAGVYYADWLTTVSPGYAAEIQSEDFGAGLHGLLRARSARLTGILNGIDETTWNPRRDPHLARRYGPKSLWGKRRDKLALQQEAGLIADPSAMLFGIVARLTGQKGIDLVPEAFSLLEDERAQLLVLGRGEARIEAQLKALAVRFPGRVRVHLGYDEVLAHRIEGGADAFLMPSRFEPCGLNQLYSMRYGTPPVVRRTGGLGDSVVDADPQALAAGTATGFVFERADAGDLAAAMRRALGCFARPETWRALQLTGMHGDFGWQHSAARYLELYRRLIDAGVS